MSFTSFSSKASLLFSPSAAHLLLFFLFLLLCEESVNPPDLGEHAPIGQTEAQPQQPKTKLDDKIGKYKYARLEAGVRQKNNIYIYILYILFFK